MSHETREKLALIANDNCIADNGDFLFQGIFYWYWCNILSICCDDQVFGSASDVQIVFRDDVAKVTISQLAFFEHL